MFIEFYDKGGLESACSSLLEESFQSRNGIRKPILFAVLKKFQFGQVIFECLDHNIHTETCCILDLPKYSLGALRRTFELQGTHGENLELFQ